MTPRATSLESLRCDNFRANSGKRVWTHVTPEVTNHADNSGPPIVSGFI
jgi:hypothetical protein